MEQLGSVSPLFHNRRILHHGDPFSCILCDRQATVGSSQLLILRHFSDIEQGTGLIVDYKDRTVIKVRYTEIQSVITLLGFKPRSVYGN